MSDEPIARDVIAREVHLQVPALQHGPIGTGFVADAVLAALAAAGWRLERDDPWEWGVRYGDGTSTRFLSEQGARRTASRADTLAVVRRRPAGEWEVAP